MKPAPLALGAAAGIAILWSAGWYAGKVLFVEPQADKAVEQVRAGDLFFSFDARRIGGFPFGYEVSYETVALSDRSTLWLVTTPRLSIESTLARAGAVTLRPHETGQAALAAALLGGAEGEDDAVFDLSFDDLEVEIEQEDDALSVALVAEAVAAVQTGAAGVLSDGALTLVAPRIDYEATRGGPVESELEAESLTFSYRASPDGVREDAGRATSNDIEVTLTADRPLTGDIAAFVKAGGAATLTFEAKASEAVSDTTGGATAASMNIAYAGGESSFEIAVKEGRARYAADAEEIVYTLTPEAGGPFPGGAVAVEEMTMALETPVLATDGLAPYLLVMELEDVTAEDALWSAIDPAGALGRDPFALSAEIGGDVRLFVDIGADARGAPPAEVETLEIRTLALSGLGVDAEATGRLEIGGVASRPDGAVRLVVTGAYDLMDRIVAAGLIPEAEMSFYRSLVALYARPGEEPDELIAEIEAKNGAVTLNGAPLQ